RAQSLRFLHSIGVMNLRASIEKLGSRYGRGLSKTLTTACLFLPLPTNVIAAPLSEQDLNAQQILKRIENGEVKNPDDLMTILPFSMRQRFALGFDSRSPHAKFVTPEAPRIVMVSDEG